MQQLLEHEDFLEMEQEDFLEFEQEGFLEMEGEQEFEGFLEMEGEGFLEMEQEDFLEMEQEDFLEMEGEGFLEMEQEDFLGSIANAIFGGELESPIGEVAEMELAAELLEVGSDAELEQFIGKLVRKAAKGVSNFARSSAGRALGGVLKNLAKKALPVVGGALGSMVAPGIGTAIGSKLGGLAGGLFEFEGEMSNEQAEFEVARRVVRISTAATRNAANQSMRGVPAVPAARRAVLAATRAYAPAALPARLRTTSPMRANGFRSRRPAGVINRRQVGARPGTVRSTPRRPTNRRPYGSAARGPGGRFVPRARNGQFISARAPYRPIGVRPGAVADPRRGIVARRGWVDPRFGPTDVGLRDFGDGQPTRAGFATSSGRWIRDGRDIVLLDV